MTEILVIFLLYWFLDWFKYVFHVNYCFEPIVMGPIVGAIMGDLQTGIIMGGMLQAIFMGVMGVGGTVPAVPGPGTVVAVYFVIESGCDIETGLALAYPISALCASIYSIFRTLRLTYIPFWKKVGMENGKRFDLLFKLYFVLQSVLFPLIVLISLSLGVDLLENLMASLPAWVMTGCNAVGGMLASVGMGVILALIWNKETAGLFFVGFICFKLLGLSLTSCSVLGVGIAFVYYFIDSRITANRLAIAKGGVGSSNSADDGGDFF